MFNIEKYLEDQKRLSIERKRNNLSEKKVANIPKQQPENSKEKRESIYSKLESVAEETQEESQDDAARGSSESEYCPSEAELETDDGFPSSSRRVSSNNRFKIKRYNDDGNVNEYTERLEKWKNTVSLNLPPEAADMNIFTRMKQGGEYHEIEDGFQIPNFIWKRLYRYQKTAVKWLWELHRIESGGLLGDEMGLGKTVQIIAFLAGISFSGRGSWGGLGPCIIVAPATVLYQWVMHFHEWWPPVRVACLHQSGSYVGTADKLVRDIHKDHGVLVTTYAGIIKYNSTIANHNWHYVILDEGHKIRNADTQISRAVRKVKTSHKIVITGSPLQNNLQELWSLFDFMSPGLLGTLPAFMEHFAIPITQGGYSNATVYQESLALSLAVALKNTITPYMLRRTKADVMDHIKLPEKSEQVLFCSLTDEQKELYRGYLCGSVVRSILDKESRIGDPMRARILVALTVLRKICNHPDLYIYDLEEDTPDENELASRSFGFWQRAGKMIVINSLLKIWKKQGHRVLIFTQSRVMIYILEQFLEQNGYKYLKMDGNTSIGSRQPLIKTFNEDDSYLVFLSTTRVGGLGVNLTGADRVIIYDPDWNPATDSQAKERAWRIGQLRNVTVYRLLSAGTIEEKIYQRQVFKQLLSNKVLLNPNQKNYLKTSTLQGLFCLEEPDKNGATETTNIFKHTKIEPDKKGKSDNKSVLLSGAVSFSTEKMDAMRKLAQEISKKLSKSDEKKDELDDPRERYKRKLQPPPPPEEEEPQVNTVDDRETGLDFGSALSEIDIINMCSKPKYTCSSSEVITECEDGEILESSECTDQFMEESVEIEKDDLRVKKRKKRKRSKGHDDDEDGGIDNIEYLKRVKSIKDKSKRKKIRDSNETQKNQDDYVLQKLFAKSGVQNALQHDKIVGLAEREERHRLKTETEKAAIYALKALRRSKFKDCKR